MEHRDAGEVQRVTASERLIDVIAVPWEQPTEIRWQGETWTETFQRGAFDGQQADVRVNREHERGRTVGKIIEVDPSHSDGLWVRVKVAKTQLGDETLALAEEDMISASVGFTVPRMGDMRIDRRNKTRRVLRASLDHLSLVEAPAFVGAKVLAVRGRSDTPHLDAVRRDPTIRWASERVERRKRRRALWKS